MPVHITVEKFPTNISGMPKKSKGASEYPELTFMLSDGPGGTPSAAVDATAATGTLLVDTEATAPAAAVTTTTTTTTTAAIIEANPSMTTMTAPVPLSDADHRSLQEMRAAFQLLNNNRMGGSNDGGMQGRTAVQGASFHIIMPANVPSKVEDFGGKEYCFIEALMGPPICPGSARAPFEYSRSSKKSKEQLTAANKAGLPLTLWGDTGHTEMRFYGWEKKGFNRGLRLQDKSWTYGGGDMMSFCMNPKDIEPVDDYRDTTMKVPSRFYEDGRMPNEDELQSFDVMRCSIMPKNKDGLEMDKKTCFVLKSVGSNVRTLSSMLPWLEAKLPRSLDEAVEKATSIIRDGKLAYAHQIDSMPPKDDRENYKESMPSTTSFLETKFGRDTIFTYDDKSFRVHMQASTGRQSYVIDVPKHAALKNANARTLHDAAAMYTIAASAPDGLRCLVMHKSFWGNSHSDAHCGLGDPTPFRGALIINAKAIMAPLTRDEFYIGTNGTKSFTLLSSAAAGSARKAKIEGVKMGFSMSLGGGGRGAGDGSDVNINDDNQEVEEVVLPVYADICLVSRNIRASEVRLIPQTEMRLSPHQSIPLDEAYVVTFYVMMEDGERRNMFNCNYNGSPDVWCTPATGGAMAGKKHAWSSATPSAIDEDDDESDGAGGAASTNTIKRLKTADNSVA